MGVEYSLIEVGISDQKTHVADSYNMVHSRFDLHHNMAIFDQSVPINFSTLVAGQKLNKRCCFKNGLTYCEKAGENGGFHGPCDIIRELNVPGNKNPQMQPRVYGILS